MGPVPALDDGLRPHAEAALRTVSLCRPRGGCRCLRQSGRADPRLQVDGLDATRMIREREREHGVRPSLIIALTASVLDEDVKRTVAAGCSMHIGKPLTTEVILDAIRTVSVSAFGAQSVGNSRQQCQFSAANSVTGAVSVH